MAGDPMDYAVDFVEMVQAKTNNPFGGFDVTWTKGIEFKCFLHLDQSMDARRAEKDGVTSVYTGIVDKNVPIEFHNVIRRVFDSATFRITSEPGDNATPDGIPHLAGRGRKFFTAEKWEIPA